jgi:hypothetical protein
VIGKPVCQGGSPMKDSSWDLRVALARRFHGRTSTWRSCSLPPIDIAPFSSTGANKTTIPRDILIGREARETISSVDVAAFMNATIMIRGEIGPNEGSFQRAFLNRPDLPRTLSYGRNERSRASTSSLSSSSVHADLGSNWMARQFGIPKRPTVKPRQKPVLNSRASWRGQPQRWTSPPGRRMSL